MKSLSFYELRSYVDWLKPLILGAQLQDIWTDGQVVVFELYKHKNYWLCFDLNSVAPQMIFLEVKPPISKKQKPITLFLAAHARDLRLTEMHVFEVRGRVIELKFTSGERKCVIEAQLIPRAVNLLAKTMDKAMSWEKPKELPPSQTSGFEKIEVDWEALGRIRSQEWLLGRVKAPEAKGKSIEKILEKKKKAVAQIQAGLDMHEENFYRELGEILKYTKDVPEHLKKYFDDKLSHSQNRERAFQKSKDIVRKRQGNSERLAELQRQIEKLEVILQSGNINEYDKTQPQSSVATQILKKSESKARKLTLASGFEAVIGKSSKDNLAILRQARAWDYWLHLRDYPGAHAILFRNKNQNVPDSVIENVSQWLISESIKENLAGIKYDVIVAECRYVKTVKGGGGQVTYNNGRTFTFTAKS